MILPAPRATFRVETVAVPAAWRRELERLSRDADPESQASLDALLDRRGTVAARARARNLVTTAGKNDLIAKYFQGSGYTATWFVGVKGAGTPAAGDTMASHASWTEVVAYSQSTRPPLTLGAPASGAASNTAARAVVTANAATTLYGWFLTSNSSKGGTSGVLYSVANYAASQALASGQAQRLLVTLSF